MIELLTLLIIFMIIAAIIAIETKDLLSSIICVGAVGFGLSIAFLFLRAPDIAITQIVVEVLVLVILIRATISRDTTSISGDREFFSLIASITLLIVILLFGILALKDLIPFGIPKSMVSQAYIEDGMRQTGASNIVTSVILDYRAYDTLGEATVLFASLLGALAILRKKSKKKIHE